ncbi:hypothetical protein HanRHA438_Chr04g0175071 [Helianthus annuus]|nr:hypothetical protein HanRHA438_Chr04g0175071 [Helianthus annuus]
MALLALVLQSYERLVEAQIGNYNLVKEDYDQIDPEEMKNVKDWIFKSPAPTIWILRVRLPSSFLLSSATNFNNIIVFWSNGFDALKLNQTGCGEGSWQRFIIVQEKVVSYVARRVLQMFGAEY